MFDQSQAKPRRKVGTDFLLQQKRFNRAGLGPGGEVPGGGVAGVGARSLSNNAE